MTGTNSAALPAAYRRAPCRLGLQGKLALSILVAVAASILIISVTLDVFGQDRVYRANLEESKAQVEAASLAFAQALHNKDEVLLDALVHELQSRRELHIKQAYVLDTTGRVVAHSRSSEYGKTYPLPTLLRTANPRSLAQIVSSGGPTFKVVSLLQTQGQTLGALTVLFTTAHLARRLHSELLWVLGTTIPVLILTGLGLLIFGRHSVHRLVELRRGLLKVGDGDWGAPLQVSGSDEIAALAQAFNEMRSRLVSLDAHNRESRETITTLNKDLNAQLETVKRLQEQLAEENAALRQRLSRVDGDPDFVGHSAPVQRLLEQARQTAPLPINVLITGESGTGKELLASFLHRHGERADRPFIKVNCAALPAALIESELFGHERGAFTGATAQRKGKFELADGGTLFLDEIGELPLESQSKLLRALQQGEIQRVGGNAPVYTDVRLIAATNRDLAAEVTQGNFREDLYYRLKVIELHCPALRARIDDLPTLAQYFVEHYGAKLEREVVGISPSALQRLAEHSWPGNVRELEHAIARAVALADTQVLGPADFAFLGETAANPQRKIQGTIRSEAGLNALLEHWGVSFPGPGSNIWDRIKEACESTCLKAALAEAGNQKGASELLGISQTKMHRLVKKYELKTDSGS